MILHRGRVHRQAWVDKKYKGVPHMVELSQVIDFVMQTLSVSLELYLRYAIEMVKLSQIINFEMKCS